MLEFLLAHPLCRRWSQVWRPRRVRKIIRGRRRRCTLPCADCRRCVSSAHGRPISTVSVLRTGTGWFLHHHRRRQYLLWRPSTGTQESLTRQVKNNNKNIKYEKPVEIISVNAVIQSGTVNK